MRKHLSLVMSNKSFVNSYRHVTLLWKAKFFKTKHCFYFTSFTTSVLTIPHPTCLYCRKRQLSVEFHLCVERTNDTNAEGSQPCFKVYVPFSAGVHHKGRIHNNPLLRQVTTLGYIKTKKYIPMTVFFKDLQDLLVSSLLHRNMWTISFLLWKMSLSSCSIAPENFAR